MQVNDGDPFVFHSTDGKPLVRIEKGYLVLSLYWNGIGGVRNRNLTIRINMSSDDAAKLIEQTALLIGQKLEKVQLYKKELQKQLRRTRSEVRTLRRTTKSGVC